MVEGESGGDNTSWILSVFSKERGDIEEDESESQEKSEGGASEWVGFNLKSNKGDISDKEDGGNTVADDKGEEQNGVPNGTDSFPLWIKVLISISVSGIIKDKAFSMVDEAGFRPESENSTLDEGDIVEKEGASNINVSKLSSETDDSSITSSRGGFDDRESEKADKSQGGDNADEDNNDDDDDDDDDEEGELSDEDDEGVRGSKENVAVSTDARELKVSKEYGSS